MDFLFGAFDTIGDDFELEDDYGEQHEESVEKDSESDMNESDSEDSDDSDDSNGHISPKLGLHAISLFRSLTRHEKKERFLMAFSEKIDRNSGKKERALQKMFKQVARVVDIQVKGRSVSAKSRMDTGADYNFITRDTVKRCGLDRTIKRNERSIALKLGDGTKTKVREKIELDWLFRQSDHIFQSTFFVLDDMPYDMIIGVGECVERGFITFNVPGKTFGALTSTLDSSKRFCQIRPLEEAVY